MNRLCFIGAGPGNPDLLTLRGREHLESCGSVFLFEPYGESFAELLAGKGLYDPFEYDYADLIALLESLLERQNVAFLLPGDLTFYCPFQSLVDHFGGRASVIPGVGVANAASAALQRTLDLPDICRYAVIVSPRTLSGDRAAALAELAEPGVTLLIYMNTFTLEELVAILRRGYGRDEPIALLHRLTLPGERVVRATLDSLVEVCAGEEFFRRSGPGKSALTLLVVGETLTAPSDGCWWDRKRKTDWRQADKADEGAAE